MYFITKILVLIIEFEMDNYYTFPPHIILTFCSIGLSASDAHIGEGRRLYLLLIF
jgi:hypothetical protein